MWRSASTSSQIPPFDLVVVDRSSFLMAGCPLDAQVTSLTHAIANDVAALSAMAGSSAQVAALTSTAVNDITALSAMTQLAVEENRELKLKVADQDQELRDTKQKLADIMLELERSRMATEDARSAMMTDKPRPNKWWSQLDVEGVRARTQRNAQPRGARGRGGRT